MPKFLSLEELGLYRAVIANAMLLVPFAMLGSSATMQRFFPRFSKNRENLIGIAFSIMLGGFSVVTTLFLIFKRHFFEYFAEKAARINDYYYLIPILLFFIVVFTLLESFSKANLNIVFPNFLRDVVYKLFTTALVFAFAFELISFDQFLYSQVVFYIIISLVLSIYIGSKFHFFRLVRKIKKPALDLKILSFSLFSFLSVAGVTIVTYIDQIMVSKYLGLALNGIYTTAVFIAVVIEYPKRFVAQISYQILVNAYEDNDIKKIEKHYKAASINQGIVGGMLLILIMVNMQNIFDFMPNGEEFARGSNVLILIAIAKLSNMLFSLSSEIVSVSKIYRYNVLLALTLGLLTIVSNLILIPKYGIEGAAMATLFSLVVYDLIKFILVKYHLGIQPFTWKTVILLAFIAGAFGVNELLPQLENFYFDAIYRSLIVASVFVLSVYLSKLSDEINNQINIYLRNLLGFLKLK
jgi:O-antigen/teichoic acid export membrane protein